jgi:uncharacterized membrane protein YfcA
VHGAGSAIAVAVAGLGAGIANGAAGGGSLIAFPALLAVGYPALTANVTTTVAIWPGYIGGTAGFADELKAQRARIRLLVPAMLSGAAVGVVCLLALPSADFRVVVPYLILVSCVLFGTQPIIARWAAARARRRGQTDERPVWEHPLFLHGGVALGAAYGAYFGAALGVMLLALLSFAIRDTLVRINGLRSAISLFVNSVGAVCFLAFAPVAWLPIPLMAVSSLVGGYLGARLSKRLPAPVLRAVIIVFGVVTAVRLLGG